MREVITSAQLTTRRHSCANGRNREERNSRLSRSIRSRARSLAEYGEMRSRKERRENENGDIAESCARVVRATDVLGARCVLTSFQFYLRNMEPEDDEFYRKASTFLARSFARRELFSRYSRHREYFAREVSRGRIQAMRRAAI